MATSKDYIQFILGQLNELDEITYRMMMGEYIIYYKGRIAAYVCDDRLLIKPVNVACEMLPNAKLEPPYKGAKDMLLIEDVDNHRLLTELFEVMYPQLPEPKPKKKKQQ